MSSYTFSIRTLQKMTFQVLDLLLNCNGIPSPTNNKPHASILFMRCLIISRKCALFVINAYLLYRIFKLFEDVNMTYDVFPFIYSIVSACSVDSIAVKYQKFDAFSKNLYYVMHKYGIFCTKKTFLKIVVLFSVLVLYFTMCLRLLPKSFHWLHPSASHENIFHTPHIKFTLHITVFIVCAGSSMVTVMLYCFICALLQQMLHSIYTELKLLQFMNNVEPESIHDIREQYLEVVRVVHEADSIFSLYGLLGLACAIVRACTCIHLHLNVNSAQNNSWCFAVIQISFDIILLSAVCCFSASVCEQNCKITPMVFLVGNRIQPKNIAFHRYCFNFTSVIMQSGVQMTAWKLFPFTRRVLPTVVSIAVSYVTVIIQMHHAAFMKHQSYDRVKGYSNATVSGN